MRADACEALIAICSTRCAHCDLAGRAHAAGRTLLYFANLFFLDLCCSDHTCVAAHASRPGVGTVRIRRFNWRQPADAEQLRALLLDAAERWPLSPKAMISTHAISKQSWRAGSA